MRYVPSASSLYTILKKPPIIGHLSQNSGHFVWHRLQGRSYVISYVARKPPSSWGRRGLAAYACARSYYVKASRVDLASESEAVYATRMLCKNGTTCAHEYGHTHVVFHSRLRSRKRCALMYGTYSECPSDTLAKRTYARA